MLYGLRILDTLEQLIYTLGRTLIYFMIATVSFMLNPKASQSSGNWNCLQVDYVWRDPHARARAHARVTHGCD